jgi:UTP--glucose-1-phosphate uridylyltransferase
MIRKVVIPIGGLGTRFLPATKSMPKEMLPIYNKPLIQYAFEEAQRAGISDFIFITGRNKNIVSNHFDNAYELQSVLDNQEKKRELELTKKWLPKAGHIAYIRQQEPLGLGHAIWCARNFINNEPFAVILPDELLYNNNEESFLKKMINNYEKAKKNSNIVGLYKVEKTETSKYGIITPKERINEKIRIVEMIEKPEPKNAKSNYAMIGRYILQPEILKTLENQKTGKNGEIQLTDSMNNLLKTQSFFGIEYEGMRYDCGDPKGFVAANLAVAKNNLSKEDFKKIINNT